MKTFFLLLQLTGSNEATKPEQSLSDNLRSSPPVMEFVESLHTSAPGPLDVDGDMDSVSARTEALAVSSTFKLRGRGRTTSSTSSQNNF